MIPGPILDLVLLISSSLCYESHVFTFSYIITFDSMPAIMYKRETETIINNIYIPQRLYLFFSQAINVGNCFNLVFDLTWHEIC